MTWVRRAETPAPAHKCEPPVRDICHGMIFRADGQHGDLWRCNCGTLWTVRDAFNTNGPEWRRAGWWTCLRHPTDKEGEGDHG